MRIDTITILSGSDKHGQPETITRLDLKPGDSLAIVGPTGSGKSELLMDIEQAVIGDSCTGRKILINGRLQDETSSNLVATLSQKTNFVMDATVAQFIELHATSKGKSEATLLQDILAVANSLCGEPISADMGLQVLSGGQSRALMIADIAILSDAPIVLIDEVENAGIDKFKALEILCGHNKIAFCATHDPVLILMNTQRLVMSNGAMSALIEADTNERRNAQSLKAMDDVLTSVRDALRHGHIIADLTTHQPITETASV